MRIAAIIAEYNPFHAGHMHHISMTRALGKADYVVAVMDGNFTQRGEAAVLEKRQRAAAALRNGCDAVFELPGLFAVRSADVFASSGVRIAKGIGADLLSFGCENADIGFLETVLCAEQDVQTIISENMKKGMSYARARGEAISHHLGIASETLNQPNLTLALEYLRTIRTEANALEPMVIPRCGGYHDTDIDARFPSASAIRAALNRGEAVREYVPGLSGDAEFARPMDELDAVFMYAIRNMNIQKLADICDVHEGLENRVCKLRTNCGTRMQLLSELKCKRYTQAHLSRVLTQAVTGMTKQLAAAHPRPEYARLIGIRKDARELITELTRRSELPIVSGCADISSNDIFLQECRMTDLFSLLSKDPKSRIAGLEYTSRFVSI